MLRLPLPTQRRPLLPHSSSSSSGGGSTAQSKARARGGGGGSSGATLLLIPILFCTLGAICCLVLLRSRAGDDPASAPIALANSQPDAAALDAFPQPLLPHVDAPPPLEDDDEEGGEEDGHSTSAHLSRVSAHARAQWLAEWGAARASLAALHLDLSSHFPRAIPAPITLSHRARQPSSYNRFAPVRRETTFTPPPTPAPPRESWIAGTEFPRMFFRDSFLSLLLLVPARHAAPWDLSDVQLGSGSGFEFESLVGANPSAGLSTLGDLHRARTTLLLASMNQGSKVDARTGEEEGKIPHEMPGQDLRRAHKGAPAQTLNTLYASSDSTPLFLLALVHYLHASSDFALLEQLLQPLVRALQWLLARVDPSSALVLEHPESQLGSRGARYALKVTTWKDSALLRREGGEPAYPAAFLLLQAQAIAAVRAVANLQRTLRAHAASVSGSRLAQLSQSLDSAMSQTREPDLDALTERMLAAMQRYFFGRREERSEAESNSATSSDAAADAESVLPSGVRVPSASKRGYCPLWGLDAQGSMGRWPAGAPLTDPNEEDASELLSSDALHALFFLQPSDLSPAERAMYEPPASARASDDAPTPWSSSDSCFQRLETQIGYVSSSLGRRVAGVKGSYARELSEREQLLARAGHKETLYHHRGLWPFEQALIHSAARRWKLRHVAQVSSRFFRALEQARTEARAQGDTVALSAFPEWLLPDEWAAPSLHPGLTLRGQTAHPRPSRESWRGVGSRNQLWTVAAWNYWAMLQWRRAQQASEQAATPTALAVAASAAAQPLSRCVTESASLLRGLRPDEYFNVCPSGAVDSHVGGGGGGLPSAYPSLVFLCRDSSALLWLHALNDEYCDCSDGSDEPGTAACARSDEERSYRAPPFACVADPARRVVHRSMIDDSVCDCCDGSDERDSGVQCPNRCRGK